MLCYNETSNVCPCHGNGWHAGIFMCAALNLQLTAHDDIKYQIKSPRTLNPKLFEDFGNNVVQPFGKYKQANNGFIRILKKNYNT
eukprot:8214914-Alexandrium_andersonii.AAC.1